MFFRNAHIKDRVALPVKRDIETMRKTLMSRILFLVFVYGFVFCFLVILQFSNKGNFTLSTGAMSIKGRYLRSSQSSLQASPQTGRENYEAGWQDITGGIKIFYGGLEFNLTEDKGKGLVITSLNGVSLPVNPNFMILEENKASFSLPGGTILVFRSSDSSRGSELQISAEFAENISEAVIHIVPRRSSLIHDNEQLGILYNGGRYFFGSSNQELEDAKLVLSKGNAFVSYRSRGKERVFDPADYIIAQSNDYENALANWLDESYAYWNRNAAVLQSEDDIIAYCGEALRRGNFAAAIASIPGNFLNSSRHSYRSSGFVGGMTAAYSSFAATEREKVNSITNLTRERSLDILKEDHVLDYLLTRNNTALASNVIEIISNASPEMLTPGYCSGLLEIYSDIKRWRLSANNPVEPLIEQILSLISESLARDTDKNLVFVSPSEGMNAANEMEYSLRLGKALIYWAEDVRNTEWLAIGRSLVLSALTGGGAGSGNLYCILNPGEYSPKATWLADNGLWAWTVSPSVRASYTNGNLNISLSFPPNMTHHVMIRGVRPFIKLQIHDMDWRTDSQFERYDSSGWVYYPQDQTLIFKLRHRVTVENIRIFYRAEEPQPVIEESAVTDNITAGDAFDF